METTDNPEPNPDPNLGTSVSPDPPPNPEPVSTSLEPTMREPEIFTTQVSAYESYDMYSEPTYYDFTVSFKFDSPEEEEKYKTNQNFKNIFNQWMSETSGFDINLLRNNKEPYTIYMIQDTVMGISNYQSEETKDYYFTFADNDNGDKYKNDPDLKNDINGYVKRKGKDFLIISKNEFGIELQKNTIKNNEKNQKEKELADKLRQYREKYIEVNMEVPTGYSTSSIPDKNGNFVSTKQPYGNTSFLVFFEKPENIGGIDINKELIEKPKLKQMIIDKLYTDIINKRYKEGDLIVFPKNDLTNFLRNINTQNDLDTKYKLPGKDYFDYVINNWKRMHPDNLVNFLVIRNNFIKDNSGFDEDDDYKYGLTVRLEKKNNNKCDVNTDFAIPNDSWKKEIISKISNDIKNNFPNTLSKIKDERFKCKPGWWRQLPFFGGKTQRKSNKRIKTKSKRTKSKRTKSKRTKKTKRSKK